MRCGIYKFIYNMVPVAWIRGLIISRHLDQCPTCSAEHSIDGPIGYSAKQVQLAEDMFQRIQRGIRQKQSPSALSVSRKWRPLYISVPASALVLLLLYLWLAPAQTVPPARDMLVVRNREIVIHSINVNENPAQTVYFQSGQKDRVIVWAQSGPLSQ